MTLAAALLAFAFAFAFAGLQPHTEPFPVRGQALDLHVYGQRGNPPIVLASGDGGWIHLAPDCAVVLAAKGYFVVGLDTKQYLSAFTRRGANLHPADVAGDFKLLVDYAAKGAKKKPVLAGVSEGAGLAVLAAVEPAVKVAVRGVVGLGLPDQTELGWRFRDSLIYVTHKAPREPSFSVLEVVARLAPLPLAQLHSTHDEYVPLEEARRVYERAGAPKRLWVIEASDHRFSNQATEFSRRLLEAMDWVAAADR
jgi:alpha-beta hydrolase superfamily lysophospholipase